MTITTKFIKDNILPKQYYGHAVTDWKRATKRKLEYDAILNDGTVLKGKLNWRVYSSEEHYTKFYIIDDGVTILYNGDECNLPGCVFDWAIQACDDTIDIFIGYKDESFEEYGDPSDDLRESSVAGFESAFRRIDGIEIDNTMENTFELYILDESKNVAIGNFETVKAYLITLMKDNFDMNYNSELEWIETEWDPVLVRARTEEISTYFETKTN